jgi:hypothetical protein
LAEVGDTAQASTASNYWLKSRQHCAGANCFYFLAEVGNTAQAPTASIYWLKSETLRRRQLLLFIG